MSVSRASFRLFAAGRCWTTSGIPSGKDSLLRGSGGFATPGIGYSLAREKVQQLGAQCWTSCSTSSESSSIRSRNTSLPRNRSQGRATLFNPFRKKSALTPGTGVVSVLGRANPYGFLPLPPLSFAGSPFDADADFSAFFCSFWAFLQPGGISQRGSCRFLQIMHILALFASSVVLSLWSSRSRFRPLPGSAPAGPFFCDPFSSP